MALEYPVVVGIPPTPCFVKSDEPTILVSFLRFIQDMSNEAAAMFLNAVSSVNPDWVTGAKAVVEVCQGLIGTPS